MTTELQNRIESGDLHFLDGLVLPGMIYVLAGITRGHFRAHIWPKAGDLAHGLKTPLAVLNQEAERAKAAGQTELAAGIARQVDRMKRQVDFTSRRRARPRRVPIQAPAVTS